ncbi:hypothetical protein [Sphingomonas quercus]|uniref:DUF2946 domain-containing protein n=1 Tax=Sphingomonas quercus TaxID=2842451 RepID=A0ABS6BKT5_9SPHN|nr:hypothetical protein [Sphingomonas quercus]MBU3078915.1 hypothetical protein [Sphingomonas quercus]
MTAGIRQSRASRDLFVALAFLVLLIRTLVPSGFMPVAMDDKVVIQLCTGAGPASIVIDRDGGSDHHPADEHKASDHPCTYSGGFTGGLLDAVPPRLAAPLVHAVTLPFGAALADLTVHRLAAPPPPAIGPPPTL